MIRVGGIFMNVKAIMCDIDGTLLSSEGVVTKKTVEMIKKSREKGILFVEDDNLVYLIDKKNKVIVSTDDLGINIIKDGYSKDRITLVTLDKMERINVEQDSELARGFNLIDAICDILSQHINVQQDKSPNRKKKRGQQQN